MNDDNRQKNEQKPDQKKSFPGGFIIFFLAALLIFLTIQNLSSDQTAKVAFSHQVEHLVDLDLIQPSESRKIAQNDNLVTLTGKFRDRIFFDKMASSSRDKWTPSPRLHDLRKNSKTVSSHSFKSPTF